MARYAPVASTNALRKPANTHEQPPLVCRIPQKGQARIRVQLSAGHEREHLDKAIAAFIKVGKELGVIK